MNYKDSLIVLNDIVNQKGELLQQLNNFTIDLFKQERRLLNEGGWYVEKKLKKKFEYG
jgi:hypothetical protein